MQLLMHIGPHKTGTTYIQRRFHGCRDGLLARGWLYPDVGCPAGMAGHHDLAQFSAKYLDQNPSLLAGLRRNQSKLVLSAEGFCNWSEQKFEKLADLLGRDEITLVYFLRDPYDVFYSFWKEDVKQGRAASLPEKFMDHFKDPFKSRLLNPLVDLKRYGQLSRRFTLKLLPYDALVADKIDIFQAIVTMAMGLDMAVAEPGRRSNEALSIEVTEFLRVLTKDLQANLGYKRKVVRRAFYKLDPDKTIATIEQAFAKDIARRRRVCRLDRSSRFYRIVQKQLLESYADHFLYLPQNRTLYPGGSATYHYYDESDIVGSQAVRPLYEDIRRRIVDIVGDGGTDVDETDLT